jgi:hypothetical protein
MTHFSQYLEETPLEKVQHYKTTDGSTFQDPNEAVYHQRWLDFAKWYQAEHEIYGATSSGKILYSDLRDWFEENSLVLPTLFARIIAAAKQCREVDNVRT